MSCYKCKCGLGRRRGEGRDEVSGYRNLPLSSQLKGVFCLNQNTQSSSQHESALSGVMHRVQIQELLKNQELYMGQNLNFSGISYFYGNLQEKSLIFRKISKNDIQAIFHDYYI